MYKLLSPIFIFILSLGMLTTPISAAELVEVRLIDNIDEARGYCLDIAGGRGKDAPLNKGLQAHTCYDYSGKLLEDQSFDNELLQQGQFKLPYFNVCMSVSSVKVGSNILLANCQDTDSQTFSLQDNGNLIIQANPELCVTASSTKKKEGRGGRPVHIMRPLSLQLCSDTNQAYQTWTIFSL